MRVNFISNGLSCSPACIGGYLAKSHCFLAEPSGPVMLTCRAGLCGNSEREATRPPSIMTKSGSYRSDSTV